MFGKIEGQSLILVKIHMANYCIALEQHAGGIDVQYVVLNINKEFGLVPQNEVKALANDELAKELSALKT
jgi:hypothetical protein